MDRDLGRRFVDALRTGGLTVEAHDEHFLPEAADEVWLGDVAKREWVILTHDAKIRYTSRAKKVIWNAGARVIVLKGKAPMADLAQAFLRTLPRVLRFLKRHDAPFIAKAYRNVERPEKPGRVEMWVSGAPP